MAARSPEPAKRWASPQSFKASPAGRRRSSISASTSMAADRRAPGVIGREKPLRNNSLGGVANVPNEPQSGLSGLTWAPRGWIATREAKRPEKPYGRPIALTTAGQPSRMLGNWGAQPYAR